MIVLASKYHKLLREFDSLKARYESRIEETSRLKEQLSDARQQLAEANEKRCQLFEKVADYHAVTSSGRAVFDPKPQPAPTFTAQKPLGRPSRREVQRTGTREFVNGIDRDLKEFYSDDAAERRAEQAPEATG